MSGEERPKRTSIFRAEALAHHQGSAQSEGDVFHLSPHWMRWSYWVVLAVAAVGLLYCTVGSVHEYAAGPAVIRVQGRTDLAMTSPGVVTSVDVLPGQRVEAGQTLVTFQATEERRSLERIRQELEAQLVRFMRDPLDQAARQSLTTLNAELDLARAQLEARTLKAPFTGVLGDVRVQPGQYLPAGAHVLSLTQREAPASLMAFLPGHYRPLLKPGMPLRVELEGFRFEYQDLIIDSVASEIIGPEEMKRSLGPELADAVAVQGPLVVVKASVPQRVFTSEGQLFNYFDGMSAQVQAPVRTEPIWTLLIPGWKGLAAHGG